MTNNENTTFGTADVQPKNENKQKTTASNSWQQVTIGGVTGILMGAAGMYAADAFAGEQQTADETQAGGTAADTTHSHTADNGLRVAEVDQNLSFGEAFAAARNKVGPGGVFHWHGGIYNTYTADEWNSMSAGDHAQFAQQVQPEVRPGEEHTGHKHDIARNDDNGPKKQDDNKDDDDNGNTPKPPKDDEPEVHFLGVERVETENGAMNVGHMAIDDQDVALVDIDDDQVFDVMATDRNQNNQIDDDEVVDISDRQLTVTDFAVASAQQNGGDVAAQPETASYTQQDQIAEDMPDYMNDADVQTI